MYFHICLGILSSEEAFFLIPQHHELEHLSGCFLTNCYPVFHSMCLLLSRILRWGLLIMFPDAHQRAWYYLLHETGRVKKKKLHSVLKVISTKIPETYSQC